MSLVDCRWVGRMGYGDALQLQQEMLAAVVAGDCAEELILLEHDPVYTIGRTRDVSSLGEAALPHPVFETNRGGQATYHGPGQLVGYPILNLGKRGRDLHSYLRFLEEFLIGICRHWGVEASIREGLTGVWVEDRKMASIGVGLRHWVSMHGFALNVCGDLGAFSKITPCGISGVRMTSLSSECGREVQVEAVARKCIELFSQSVDTALPVRGDSSKPPPLRPPRNPARH